MAQGGLTITVARRWWVGPAMRVLTVLVVLGVPVDALRGVVSVVSRFGVKRVR